MIVSLVYETKTNGTFVLYLSLCAMMSCMPLGDAYAYYCNSATYAFRFCFAKVGRKAEMAILRACDF